MFHGTDEINIEVSEVAGKEAQLHTIPFSSPGIPLAYWKQLFRQNKINGFFTKDKQTPNFRMS